MPPAGVELFVLEVCFGVDCRRVERRVDRPQDGHHVGVRVADAADLEIVLVDVDDLDAVDREAARRALRNVPAEFTRPRPVRYNAAVTGQPSSRRIPDRAAIPP